jgi:putative redox protein
MSQIKVSVEQVSTFTSEAAIRQHRVLVDRPAAKGGSDAGPMGGELFLAAVGGCFMSNLLAAAAARDAKISGVRTEVTGTLAESGAARFAVVELVVTADYPDRNLMEKLVEIAERGCIMVNTLKGSLDLRVGLHLACTTPAG